MVASGAKVACLAMLLGVGAVAVSDEASAQYRWTARPLYVFAPNDQDARLQTQLKMLAANRAGFADRDMAVIVVTGNSVSVALGANAKASAGVLRQRFGVDETAFKAVLVGKDGGVKLSSAQPFDAETLFSTIDAMPMRKREMRR